jgi:hypothetical protein
MDEPNEAAVADLFAPYPPEVRDLAARTRALVRSLIPDAAEEIDTNPRLLGYTYRPGTYKGLILAIMPQKTYVNVVFSKGVELLELDSAGLLEGTGKVARHLKVREPERLDRPEVRTLITEAAARTPR